ncbi:hypothetical protein MEI_00863 [Bartonella vinsonii subsp. arupensis Pm136co]|uniref:Uncharacterized protein n=1 Tax=Bartonella vinsonii subsp. arupensis Pm136co TaxID=1094561 RepID=A0ABP2QTZ6_BARVI|nr:hypothetical protein MEI_00863 [Bartonella vinsonii subsp. arupensis Pm136co]
MCVNDLLFTVGFLYARFNHNVKGMISLLPMHVN